MIPSHIDSNGGANSPRQSRKRPSSQGRLFQRIPTQHDRPNLLFQPNPIYSNPSQFKEKLWTKTIVGYTNEANKLALCLLRNRKLTKRPYLWFVTINIEREMDAQEVAALWKQVTRKLRQQRINAFWRREPTRSNKIHYHLLVTNKITKTALTKIIKGAMPVRSALRWHKAIRAITDEYMLCHYITKAEISGFDKRTGRPVKDLFAKKRLLFKSKLKIRTHGTIGDFWFKRPQLIWKDFQDTEKRIAKGLDDHRVRKIVKHIHELVGDQVSLQQIKRSYGYFADEQNIWQWLETIAD